jgi:hypothetical protein
MITSGDAFYVVIPVANSVGNIALKLSVDRMKTHGRMQFALLQAVGYAIFVGVSASSYLYLVSHAASHFVIVLALNYLVTIYSARFLFDSRVSLRNFLCDCLMVAGMVVSSL